MAVQRKVLLVEDDDSMRSALERLLVAHQFNCSAFTSAEALLALGGGEAASCVVSDLRLPAMSGLDLADAMRAQGGWPPLILITAHDTPGLEAEARRRGAAGYLPKPFRGTVLIDTIEQLTETQGAHH